MRADDQGRGQGHHQGHGGGGGHVQCSHRAQVMCDNIQGVPNNCFSEAKTLAQK